MWVITVVDTQSGYKPNGGSWASVRDPRLFTSHSDVERYLRKFYLDYVHANTGEWLFAKGGKLADERECFTPDFQVKNEYRLSLATLKRLAQILATDEGELSTLDVYVHEVQPDQPVVQVELYEEYSDSEGEE